MSTEPDPMVGRRGYLITPKEELRRILELEPRPDAPGCETMVVITPEVHFERDLEGWRKAWLAKAKLDFVTDFIEAWGNDEDGAYREVADGIRSEADLMNGFDRFWEIQQCEDVLELPSDWRPS